LHGQNGFDPIAFEDEFSQRFATASFTMR